MNIRIITLLYFFVFWVIIAGCSQKTAEIEQESIERRAPPQQLSIAEQKKEAFDILTEILQLSDGPEREKNLPEIKSLYREIIDKYPDLGLAQESYLRLVIEAKKENTSAGDAEAERLYREFLQKYQGSGMQPLIESELKKN